MECCFSMITISLLYKVGAGVDDKDGRGRLRRPPSLLLA
jgi:hypothetical protein